MKTEKKTVIKNVDFSDYINKLKESVKKKEKLALQDLNIIFKPANVVFTNYEDYFKTVVDEKEKEAAPTKEEFALIASKQKGFAFALYNTNIDKINVVVQPDVFIKKLDSDQIKVLEMTLNHESIHVQQAEQIGKENYKLDISPFRDPEGYFSREDEIMAYANSAVYDLLNIHGCSKKEISDLIEKKDVPFQSLIQVVNKFLSDEQYKLFKEYVLLYLQDEPTSEEIKKEKVCVVKNENIKKEKKTKRIVVKLNLDAFLDWRILREDGQKSIDIKKLEKDGFIPIHKRVNNSEVLFSEISFLPCGCCKENIVENYEEIKGSKSIKFEAFFFVTKIIGGKFDIEWV
jgi:hypothetical protein